MLNDEFSQKFTYFENIFLVKHKNQIDSLHFF